MRVMKNMFFMSPITLIRSQRLLDRQEYKIRSDCAILLSQGLLETNRNSKKE